MRASDVWNRYVAPRRQGTASSKTGGAGQDDDRVETVAAVQPWTEAPSRTNHEAIESMEKRYESLLRTSVLDAMKKEFEGTRTDLGAFYVWKCKETVSTLLQSDPEVGEVARTTKRSEAVTLAEAAVMLRPENCEATYHAAYVLKLVGHRKQALKAAPRKDRWGSALTQLESRCQFKCAIEMLPAEVFIRILSLLPIRAVVQASCVCRRWNRVGTLTKRLWQPYRRDTPHISTVHALVPLLTRHEELDGLYWEVADAMRAHVHEPEIWMSTSHFCNVISRSWLIMCHIFGTQPAQGATPSIQRMKASFFPELGWPSVETAEVLRGRTAEDITCSVLHWAREEWRNAGSIEWQERCAAPPWAYLRDDGEELEEAAPVVNQVWRNVCAYMAHEAALDSRE